MPGTSVAPNYIYQAINEPVLESSKNYKVIWIGEIPATQIVQKSKKGNKWEELQMVFQNNQNTVSINTSLEQGNWLLAILPQMSIKNGYGLALSEVKASYQNAGLEGFELFWDNKPITQMHKVGLLKV